MNALHRLALVVVVLLISPVTPMAADAQEGIPAKLRKIVEVRRASLAHHRDLMAANRGGATAEAGWALELALVSAELELARETGDAPSVLKVLHGIVTLRTQILEAAKTAHEAGRGDAASLSEATVDLLQAEIALEREQLNQNQSQTKK